MKIEELSLFILMKIEEFSLFIPMKIEELFLFILMKIAKGLVVLETTLGVTKSFCSLLDLQDVTVSTCRISS